LNYFFPDDVNSVTPSTHLDSMRNVEIEEVHHPAKSQKLLNDISELAQIMPFPQSIHDVSFDEIIHPAEEILAKEVRGANHVRNGKNTRHELDGVEPILVPAFWDPYAVIMNATSKSEDFLTENDKSYLKKVLAPLQNGYPSVRKYLGNYGQRLMTPEEAKSIGSYIPVTSQKFSNRKSFLHGKEKLETIFVAIASYRDFQCRQTVESIFSRARFPERIRVAVVDQYAFGEDTPCSQPEVPCGEDPFQILCKYKSQIDFFEIEAKYSVGPVFARHLGNRMYRGEYYAMQSDAHVDYVKDWDIRTTTELDSSSNEMAILTTYLSDVTGSLDKDGNSMRSTRPIMCKSDYEGFGSDKHLRHGQQPEGEAMVHGEPTLEPFWAAGFSFSRGHFIVNIPYDQHLPMIFQGEEISIGLRAFSYGYDFYTPQHSHCFHYYGTGEAAVKAHRNTIPTFWENSQKYSGVADKGMRRLNGIIQMNPEIDRNTWNHADETLYGVGNVRELQKFFETFGIDTVKKKTQDHLCQFAGRNMHWIFKQYLRQNRMGIDYQHINYKFKDPDIHGRTWVHLLPKNQLNV